MRETILSSYEPQLAAIAALDQLYYTTKTPNAEERAAYAARQQELQAIRAYMYQELIAASTRNAPQRATPPATGTLCDKEPEHQLCSIKHDALNKLSIALGRCQLLIDSVADEASATQHIARIIEALNEMTPCLRQPCPRDRKAPPNKRIL